ncbi:hypothetical protein [Stenotrophomonas terrae]|uniref:hypothetical protein n=1 Tax=Stenotrophomonas terrae TaxID=405446 RepID=UPI00128F9370|nr:hypothetical protein [Stenotrophomonas terrae]
MKKSPVLRGFFLSEEFFLSMRHYLDGRAGLIECVNGAAAIQALLHGLLQTVEFNAATGDPAAERVVRCHLVATFHHQHAATGAADVVPRSMGFRAPRLAKI